MEILDGFKLTPAIIIAMIIGLVELAKSIPFVAKQTRLVSFLLGVIFGGLYIAQEIYPEVAQPIIVLIYMLVFGLVASGLWDAGRNITRV